MLDQLIQLEKVRQAFNPTSVLGLEHPCFFDVLSLAVVSDPRARREWVSMLRLTE